MKHEQLVAGLCHLGFESDAHHLDLWRVVAELMGIREPDRKTEWFEVYMAFLGKAGTYPVRADNEHLLPLAEAFWESLGGVN
ncbi:MAG: hypothetical protein V4590_03135 [Bacteroidota bacterium]